MRWLGLQMSLLAFACVALAVALNHAGAAAAANAAANTAAPAAAAAVAHGGCTCTFLSVLPMSCIKTDFGPRGGGGGVNGTIF